METVFADAEQAEEVMVMEDVNGKMGICSTCIHLEDCVHRKNADQAIWFCEDFDDSVAVETRKPEVSTERHKSTPIENGYMGLCVNCDHREYCINAKQAGGVWQCEEYQ